MSLALRGTLRSLISLFQGETESTPSTIRAPVPGASWCESDDDHESSIKTKRRHGRWDKWEKYDPPRQHWGAAVVCKLEGILPLQANVQLMTPALIERVWRTQFGCTLDLSSPAGALRSTTYLAHHARGWWEEAYDVQLDRNFPHDDIDFLLDRADEILRDMTATQDAIALLMDKYEWINAGRTASPLPRCDSPRPMDIMTARRHAGTLTLSANEAQSLTNLLSTNMTPLSSSTSTTPSTMSRRESSNLGTSFTSVAGSGGGHLSRRPSRASSRRRKSNGSAAQVTCQRHPDEPLASDGVCHPCRYDLSIARREISFELNNARVSLGGVHRLIALRETVRSLLTYLRTRARLESAALNARETDGNPAATDAKVLERLLAIDHWHIPRELRMDHLEKTTNEWFARIPPIFESLEELSARTVYLLG